LATFLVSLFRGCTVVDTGVSIAARIAILAGTSGKCKAFIACGPRSLGSVGIVGKAARVACAFTTKEVSASTRFDVGVMRKDARVAAHARALGKLEARTLFVGVLLFVVVEFTPRALGFNFLSIF
jgi:hypothetical protein